MNVTQKSSGVNLVSVYHIQLKSEEDYGYFHTLPRPGLRFQRIQHILLRIQYTLSRLREGGFLIRKQKYNYFTVQKKVFFVKIHQH